mgnify:CR=1 FL=1
MPKETRGTLIRHWEMLRLIPKEPGSISAGDLHKKLDELGFKVTKRTVERDLNSLSEAGFPLVFDDTDQPYLWSWSRLSSGFHAPNMSVSDALLTVMASMTLNDLLPSMLSSTLNDLKQEAEKVLDAVQHSSNLSSWRNKIAVKLPMQPLIAPAIDAQVKADIYDALLRDEQIEVQYKSRSKEHGEQAGCYVLNPLGVIQRGWIIYLAATFDGYSDVRLLAMNRIENTRRLYAPVNKPKGFKLSKYLEDGFADFGAGQQIELKAVVSKQLRKHLQESKLSEDQKIVDSEQGSILSATVPMTQQLIWWVRGLGSQIEVIEPSVLKAQLEDM